MRRISAVARASGRARWHGSVETPKKCASVASPTRRVRSPRSRRASHTVSTTGAAMRRPVRLVTSRSRNARSNRALCATSAASPANARSCLTACSARGAPRRVARLDAGQRGDGGWQGDARVDERLECVLELERANALGADLADPRRAGREARRLEVDDDEVRVLEEDVRARRRPRARPTSPARRDGRHRRRRRRAGSARAPRARSRARRAPAPPPPPARARGGPRPARPADRRRRTTAAWTEP